MRVKNVLDQQGRCIVEECQDAGYGGMFSDAKGECQGRSAKVAGSWFDCRTARAFCLVPKFLYLLRVTSVPGPSPRHCAGRNTADEAMLQRWQEFQI